MENNNNNNSVPATTDNGSASQDSFITDDTNSKDVPVMTTNAGAAATDGDGNLSPISDSELEDEDATNDTTDARPVSPVPEAEPISQSNDGGEKEEPVVNDNEGTTQDKETEEEDNLPSTTNDDTNTGDVEMRDVAAEDEEVTPAEPEKDVDQENNNNTESVATATGDDAPGDSSVPETAEAEQGDQPPEEPMDVDETDKSKKVTTSTETEGDAAGQVGDETLEENPEQDTSTTGDQVTNAEEAHFHEVTENHNESGNVSTTENQPDTDMLNDVTMNAEEETAQQGQTNGEENAEQHVQEIEIGTFRDVTVTTEEILSRAAYDKILEDTQKNISEFNT